VFLQNMVNICNVVACQVLPVRKGSKCEYWQVYKDLFIYPLLTCGVMYELFTACPQLFVPTIRDFINVRSIDQITYISHVLYYICIISEFPHRRGVSYGIRK
jgi:hypothetical protein